MEIASLIIAFLSVKSIVSYQVYSALFSPKKAVPFSKKRSRSKIRNRFNSVSETAAFYKWKEYIRITLLEIEADNVLKDQEGKKYHSI